MNRKEYQRRKGETDYDVKEVLRLSEKIRRISSELSLEIFPKPYSTGEEIKEAIEEAGRSVREI